MKKLSIIFLFGFLWHVFVHIHLRIKMGRLENLVVRRAAVAVAVAAAAVVVVVGRSELQL